MRRAFGVDPKKRVEKLGEDGKSIRGEGITYSERLLAAAVIRQAFSDLGGDKVTPGRDRRSALRFLAFDLWREDCLWREVLGGVLVKRMVLNEVRDTFNRTLNTRRTEMSDKGWQKFREDYMHALGPTFRDAVLRIRPSDHAFGDLMRLMPA